MRHRVLPLVLSLAALAAFASCAAQSTSPASSNTSTASAAPQATTATPARPAVVPVAGLESDEAREARMEWWRDARFGMFIHWGLYAVPAGEWNGKEAKGAGEWILTNAKIKVEDYEPLQKQFNPVKFDAKRWVEIAKNAGMKYIVITSKHHDGFCLWDSKATEWDVMNTPFKRDILKELADACAAANIKLCFYHSIMDWHHPDYLPRRAWDTRPSEGAKFDNYRAYMKDELKELLSERYGDIGVLWFDGEWEATWNHEYGKDLDDYVRSLKPNIIINNRVDVGRDGMAGQTRSNPDRFRGDFGTPEQEIPATGRPGQDWETCMTMNDTWGFSKHDLNWKAPATLIRMLCDIASKGGNFLLNVGPNAAGEIPQASVERLAAMGAWMKTNGESIYGTSASAFPSLSWGRSTTKMRGSDTTLYFQVFEWPSDGKLVIDGLLNDPRNARLLGGGTLKAERQGGSVVINVPTTAPDPIASVVAIDFNGPPRVIPPVALKPAGGNFVDAIQISSAPMPDGVVIRYEINSRRNNADPTKDSPALNAIALRASSTVKAQAFIGDVPVGPIVSQTYTKVEPWGFVRRDRSIVPVDGYTGVIVDGKFSTVDELKSQVPETIPPAASWGWGLPEGKTENFGLYYRIFVQFPYVAMWRFRLGSDDGSRLVIDDHLIIDNDGLHSYKVLEGEAPLTGTLHQIELWYFNRDGSKGLDLEWCGSDGKWKKLEPKDFYKAPAGPRQSSAPTPPAPTRQRPGTSSDPTAPARPQRPASDPLSPSRPSR